MDEIASLDWDIIPKDEYKYDWVAEEIKEVKEFLMYPNKNREPFSYLIRALVKDILEIDAGVIVKVFDVNSYDFDNIEPKSGAPMLKPKGQRRLTELYVRDGACLKFGSMIETDLGFIPIGKIVNDKIKCNVKSFNRDTGQIEWKPITNWYNNGISTDWITIKAKTNKKFRSLTCTPNHNIYTEAGYIPANNLNVGDKIYTQQEKLSPDQHQIILGSLLGDASLSCGGSEYSKYKLSETHCVKQRDYLMWKADMLSPLGINIDNFLSSYGKGYEPTEKMRISTRANIIFEDYYYLKYPNLTTEIVNDLNEIGLAVWIQDDGNFNKGAYSISCGNVAFETLIKIAKKLEDKFKINFKVRKGTRENLIEVGRAEGQKLKELIKPYIHPSMSYKVNGEKCGQKLDKLSKETTTEIIETEIYKKSAFQYYDARYDIEVADNHNFFAQGILVSNSFLKEIDKFGFEHGFWQYSYQIPAHPMWFNRDEIVYIQEHSRSMSCYGYARTQSILDIVKSLHYSTLYNKRFFEETPIPDGALSLLDTNETEMRSFMSYWNNEFKAQPHKVAIMNKDIKWQPFAVSQRELEFLDTQKWYFNMVISAFGLSPSELGVTDDLNRATSATQSELVKRKGVRPFLKLLEDFINKGVISEFGHDGIQFQFIYDDPAEKNARLSNWNLELTMGVKTINEVRNEMGMEPIEGGDVSNNMRSIFGGSNYGIQTNTNQEDKRQNDTEQREAQDYPQVLQREEGKNEKGAPLNFEKPGMGRSDEWWDIYHALIEQGHSKESAARIASSKIKKSADTFEFKNDGNAKEILRSSIASELSAISLYENLANKTNDTELKTILLDIAQEEKVHVGEFQMLLDKLDSENEESRAEGEREAEQVVKGLYDGQYYFNQPISQPMKPSGAMYQPQNQRTGLRDGTGPFRNNPNCPNNLINCPICGMPTLTALESEENLEDDLRCSSCGARFRKQDLLNAPMMEEMANLLNNDLTKSLKKVADDKMTIKEFCGFDVHKSLPWASEYASTPQYFKLLSKYLSDLSETDIKSIIEILKDDLTGNFHIFDIAQHINEVINDYSRAQLIARTEVIRIANEGHLGMMEAKGTKYVKWIAAPEDGRLCKLCKEKDGKIFTVAEAHGMIPLHCRCRCGFTEVEDY